MKYFVIFLVLIGFLLSPVYADNLFDGKASFEQVPELIIPQKHETFEIKFQYSVQPYVLQNLTAIIETNPRDASPHVTLESEPVEVNPGEISRIPVNIFVDEKIRHEKIFLSFSYVGIGLNGAQYKSAWADSLILDISPKDQRGIALNDCKPIDLKTEIINGTALMTCHSSKANSVKVFAESNTNSTLSVSIPKSLVYSLSTKDCQTTNENFVLLNGEEIDSEISENENLNVFTMDIPLGISEIEIIGTTIMPRPSPDQYCGIVLGYDSQYLPPKKQTERGVELRFIQCNDDFQLVVKYDDTPACVSSENKAKFLKRGWSNPEKHTVFSKPIVEETLEIKIKEISKNSILSKGAGFDLPEDMFTVDDYQNLRQEEQELKKIIATQNISSEEREKIIEDINSMQERLWYPYQTGVPYELVQVLKEKNEIIMSGWVDLQETGVYIIDTGDDISHEHQALIVGIHPDSFTLEQIEKLDPHLREKIGNEMNILYKISQGIVPSITELKAKPLQWDFRTLPSYVIIPKGSANPDNQFHLIPQEITVFLGKNNTVTWVNEDDVPSTLISDLSEWSTGLIVPGETASITFNQTGVYDYHGQPHPWKTGKIIVLED